VYELLSLDGVAEDPDGFFADWDDAMDANLAAVIATQDAVILGRRSYTEWAQFCHLEAPRRGRSARFEASTTRQTSGVQSAPDTFKRRHSAAANSVVKGRDPMPRGDLPGTAEGGCHLGSGGLVAQGHDMQRVHHRKIG